MKEIRALTPQAGSHSKGMSFARLSGATEVIYMPACVAWAYPLDAWEQVEQHIGTARLLSAAEALGVKACIFYAAVNEGSEEDRLRDLLMSRFPLRALFANRSRKLHLVEKLYKDYLGARTELR